MKELEANFKRALTASRLMYVRRKLRLSCASIRQLADAKLAAVKAQLATANAQTQARLAHRFACVSGSLDARELGLKQAADLVKQARL